MKEIGAHRSRYWDSLFSPEELWLIELLFRENQNPVDFYSTEEEKEFVDYLNRNGLAQVLYRHKSVDYLTGVSKLKLRKEYLSNLGRNTAFHLIGDEICKILTDHNIDTILLKGSFLSRYVYEDPALRPMSDIDILVPEKYAIKAWALLSGNDPDPQQTDRFGHHLPALLYRGATIEIHNSLFALNSKYKLPVGLIWQFSEMHADGRYRVLNPYHQIIYLSLHLYYTFRQGGLRMGWFYDLKKLFGYYEDQINQFDFDELVNVLNLRRPVSLVIALYTILDPASPIKAGIDKSMLRDLRKMIVFFRISGERTPEYGYTVAWERIWHTKGLMNKLSFMHHLVMNDTTGKKSPLFYRLWYLFRNTMRMIWRLLMRK
jgi:hypothetical protein